MGIQTEDRSTAFRSVFYKHLLAWSIFIAYEIAYLYLTAGSMPDINGLIINYVLNISLFYFNAHVLLRYLGERIHAKWPTIITIVALEIMVFIAVKYFVNLIFLGDLIRLNTMEEFRVYFVSNTLRSFYYISFSTAYWLSIITGQRNEEINNLKTQRLVQENKELLLQKDLVSARNAYLQSQINPHFLFNTLNFMYNASVKVSEKLSNSILTLSDIMRYALTHVEEDQKVLITKEIEHIKNFIHLNQVRFDHQLFIDFVVKGDLGNKRIIPLSLITIVENVFKYGDLVDSRHPAFILLSIDMNELDFQVSNKKRAGHVLPGHGTGMKNLQERLSIHYPEAYNLEINENKSHYTLRLKLLLN